MIQTIQQNREYIAADFMGFINGAFKTNGAIFACMLCRALLFSEARFIFQRMNNGRPGLLFGTRDLELLENPWPNATTGDLLTKAIIDVDLSGNYYAAKVARLDRKGMKIARLRPDWVTIIKGTTEDSDLSQTWDPSAELLGYIYTPGGPGSPIPPKIFLPDEICHVAPIPDPIATYRGMSWVQPILIEVLGDRAMATHKVMYFENGATPNMVVSMDTGKMDRKTFQEWVDAFEAEHAGSLNAYKTLYLGQGATATVVGTNLRDLDYSMVVGQTELRIAAAAGIPPMLLGFDKGLQASTLANYSQARRWCADRTMRPLWRNFVGSMATLVPPPPGARLWYDDRDIPFLKDDESDMANVMLTKATAMRLLTDAGFDPDSIVAAIENNDFTKLTHSGLYSVQLRPPGSEQQMPANAAGIGNGNGNGNGAAPPPAIGGPEGVVASSTITDSSVAARRTMLANVHNVEQLAKALIAARAGD
jgi:phage portal protein BeeE